VRIDDNQGEHRPWRIRAKKAAKRRRKQHHMNATQTHTIRSPRPTDLEKNRIVLFLLAILSLTTEFDPERHLFRRHQAAAIGINPCTDHLDIYKGNIIPR
jgi:hypothetical protein